MLADDDPDGLIKNSAANIHTPVVLHKNKQSNIMTRLATVAAIALVGTANAFTGEKGVTIVHVTEILCRTELVQA